MSEDLQRKYMEFQFLDQQIKQFQQQLSIFNQQLNELNNLEEHLNELEKVKPNTSMMAPLGAGIFVKAELKDNKNVLMNVGSKIVTLKTIEEAKQIVGVQVKELNKIVKEMQEENAKAVAKCDELQIEIQQAATEMKDK